MDQDERPKGKRKRGGPRRRRNKETHGEEDTQENRAQGKRSIKPSQRYIKTEGRDIVKREERAQNEPNKVGQEKLMNPGVGATVRTIVSEGRVSLATPEGGNDGARWEKEPEHEAAGQEKPVERVNSRRNTPMRRQRYGKQEAKRQEKARREQEASTLREQVHANGDATTGVDVEKDGEVIDEDDFDIDIYGDEETRRKYGKRRRVA